MRKKNNPVSYFFILFFAAIFLFGLSKIDFFSSGINGVVTFLGKNIYGLSLFNSSGNKKLSELDDQNKILLKKLKDYETIKSENNALRDQFRNSTSERLDLLEASIIGHPSETYIIDKGSKDGVKVGQAVIVLDMVVGKISKVSSNISMITLLYNPSFSVTSKDINTQALGAVKGMNNGELLLDNVLLSEKINMLDMIVTKGDVNSEGVGFPPDLILGKITSIDKKPSALFQSAKIKSPVDFRKLSKVFIVFGIK